jgi:hypothetical protein
MQVHSPAVLSCIFAGVLCGASASARAADAAPPYGLFTAQTSLGDMTVYNNAGYPTKTEYQGQTLGAINALQLVKWSGGYTGANNAQTFVAEKSDGMEISAKVFSEGAGVPLHAGVDATWRWNNPEIWLEVPLALELHDPANTALKITVSGHVNGEGADFPFKLSLSAEDKSGQVLSLLNLSQTIAGAGPAPDFIGLLPAGFNLNKLVLSAHMDAPTFRTQGSALKAGYELDSFLIQPTAVPEAGGIGMFSLGLLGLSFAARRRAAN